MMADIAGLEYTKLLYAADGSLAPGAKEKYPSDITDVIVVSHGWHVDPGDANSWYHQLIGNLVTEAGTQWTADKRVFGVIGIFWPSDKFRDDLSAEGFVQIPADIGAGAAASFGDADESRLIKQARSLADFLQIEDVEAFIEEVQLAAAGNGRNGDAAVLVHRLQQTVLSAPDGGSPATTAIRDEAEREHAELLDRGNAREIIAALATQGVPGCLDVSTAGGAAAALAETDQGAALGVLSGIRAGVVRLLNQFAYFEIKARAGAIGTALGGRLAKATALDGVRIHLVGHSFGARLVTAAALAMKDQPASSLTLLQGALSHNSLGTGIKHSGKTIDGAFRKVVADRLVIGPIAITHTWNDTAVGLAYPAASRVSGSIANAIGVTNWFGGPDDIYGGIGANGALRLAAGEGSASTFNGTGAPLLTPGHVNNLRCDFIQDHNDVGRASVARIIMAVTRLSI